MATRYQPPKQGRSGQIIDCVFILALVYASLLLPLLLGGGANQYVRPDAKENPTWESLEQNATMQAQWQKLGMSAEEAGEIVNTRFDYSINPWALALTAIVIVGYFVFVLRLSDKEYREVINEKFGEKDRPTTGASRR